VTRQSDINEVAGATRLRDASSTTRAITGTDAGTLTMGLVTR
jgi:hypothetical protein